MAAYSGWFASVTDQSTFDIPIPGFGSDEVWTLDGTVIAVAFGSNVRWLQSNSSTTYFVYGPSSFEMVKGNSNAADWVNVGGRTEGIPVHIIVEGDGAGGTTLIMDDENEGKQQGGSLWSIHHLNGTVGNDTTTGYLEIRNSAGIPVVQLSGNMVLAADDDGSQTSFVSRTAADADPSLAKEANYTNRLYDISGNGHNATLQGNVNWIFKSEIVLPDRLVSGETGVPFSVPSGTEVTDVILNGKSIDYTYDYATSSGLINAPNLGTSTGFPKFGDSVEMKVVDSINNTESTKNIEWVPASPYTFTVLNTDDTSTGPEKAYHNWSDPPVSTDVAVYDPTNYSINQYATLTVREDAPASFAVTEYVIDENGIQSFERNSASPTQVGDLPELTLNGQSTVTVTEGAGYTDEGATWIDTEDGTGVVYSDTVVDNQTVPGSYTLRYQYTDMDDNTVSVIRTVNVEAEQVVSGSTLNLTVIGIGTGSRSVVLHDRTTREVVYDGAVSFTNDVGSVVLSEVEIGTSLYGAYFGNTPLDDGTGLYGVTE